ncbi:DoxX family protein [Pseudonocardia spinosispora]|uniref:DoxX family protein n=1 Tax=Pseudonocardia spinosispora TaxID=103441 RepID=UPI0006849B6B|nr:DoxX family protein [Pseudonocardia spinosispora]
MTWASGREQRYSAYDADPEEPTVTMDKPGRVAHQVRWHSGADLGLLVLRVVLGVIFIGHGAQKMFGVFGGPGISGAAAFLATNGFQQSSLLAGLTAVTELGGGAMLVLGAFTPLAAAGLLAIMINAIWLKLPGGFFLAPEGRGYEFELVLAGAATAVVLTGAGRLALDRVLPLFRRSAAIGFPCLVLGVGAAVAARLLLHTP